VNPPPGAEVQLHSSELAIIGQQADLIFGIPAADLKAELERTTLSGEPLFSSYRFALQSRSPVEKFMHLYSLLLRFFKDEQAKVDELFAVKIRLCRSRQIHALVVALGKPSIRGFEMNSRIDGQM